MKALPLDLNRANMPGAGAGLVALLAAVALLLVAIQALSDLKDQGADLDTRETGVAKEEKRFEAIASAHRKAASTQADSLMAMQRFAAEPARDLIERGWNPGMAFLSLDIITGSRQINLVMETRTAQEALSFADWLEKEPATQAVAVKRQIEKTGPTKSVESSLQITWRPFTGRPSSEAPAGKGSAAEAAK